MHVAVKKCVIVGMNLQIVLWSWSRCTR